MTGGLVRAATIVRHRWSDIPAEAITPSIGRQFIAAERVTLARFQLKQGGVVPRHAHEQEQLSYVLEGALTFVVNGQDVLVSAGEVVQIPSWTEHEVRVVEDTLVIDVFSPVRQDWIDKTDTYFLK
jgi:quercetin dioxygenase-like cupin family protein